MGKQWLATILYATETHGELEVDFAYDDKSELQAFTMSPTAPPLSCLRSITTKPQPDKLLPNDTIEAWMRRLEQIEELRDCPVGTPDAPARSPSPNSRSTGDHANATHSSGTDRPRSRRDRDPLIGAE